MRLFICQAVPNNFIMKYNVSQAASTFCFDLIDGDCFNKTLSVIPITVNNNIKDDCNYYNTEFIQSRIFKNNKIFRVYNNLIENILVVIKSIKAKHIWFYNITTTNIIAVFILKFFLFKNVYAIIADFTPPKNIFSINNIINFLIKKLNGIITLSERADFYNKNNKCIVGIVPINKIKTHENKNKNNKFLFSGVLNELKGIDMAIDVFSKIPNAELIISGRGDFKLKSKISKYKNIKYLGFLSQEEYKKVFSEISFCLNFRNPSFPENKNNFPSKILEYFSFNKIVISTIEYPELSSFNYFYVPFNKEQIINKINYLLDLPKNKMNKYINHNDKLKENFSEKKWKSSFSEIENNKL